MAIAPYSTFSAFEFYVRLKYLFYQALSCLSTLSIFFPCY